MNAPRANKLIRDARAASGLSSVDIAKQTGLSIAEYEDVEQHADEFISSISLNHALAISKATGQALTELIRNEPLPANSGSHLSAKYAGMSKHFLIREHRELQHLSTQQLADAVGFEERVILDAETKANFVNTLPICLLADLATVLKLPVSVLLAQS